MLSYEKTGSRYEIQDTRRMRKIFIKDIFNILLLSLIQTYKYELTLMVGKSCLATLGSAKIYTLKFAMLPFIKLEYGPGYQLYGNSVNF